MYLKWLLNGANGLRAPEGGDGGGSGGGNPPNGGGAEGGGSGEGGDPPKFTQDEVNNLVARERRKIEQKFGDYDQIKEKAAKVDDLTAKVDDLSEQIENAGKSAEEKERARQEKERQKVAKEREAEREELDTIKKQLESERNAHRTTRLQYTLGGALSEAGVLSSASRHALGAMMQESEFSTDDETGELLSISYGSQKFTDVKEAAQAFLKANPHFVPARSGGVGTQPPNGGGRPTSDKPLHEQGTDELLRADAALRSG